VIGISEWGCKIPSFGVNTTAIPLLF